MFTSPAHFDLDIYQGKNPPAHLKSNPGANLLKENPGPAPFPGTCSTHEPGKGFRTAWHGHVSEQLNWAMGSGSAEDIDGDDAVPGDAPRAAGHARGTRRGTSQGTRQRTCQGTHRGTCKGDAPRNVPGDEPRDASRNASKNAPGDARSFVNYAASALPGPRSLVNYVASAPQGQDPS